MHGPPFGSRRRGGLPRVRAEPICGAAMGTAAGLARYRDMPSTVIRRFAFRPVEAALDVEFTTGRVYRYFAVPERVARGLAESGARGIYFNREIRDRFAFERLGGWEAPPPDGLVAA